MIIRMLREEDIPAAKALWDEAFGDSPVYRDWYFGNRILPGNSFGVFSEKEMCSMAHMIRFTIDWYGQHLQSACIAGVATWPKYREKGLANSLIKSCLAYLREQDIPIAFLYPFRQSFYRPSGFATVSNMLRVTMNHGSLDALSAEGYILRKAEMPDEWKKVHRVYERMAEGNTGFPVRGEVSWMLRTKEWETDGGSLLVLEKGGICSGYAFFQPLKNGGEVMEWGVYDAEDFAAICCLLLRRCGNTTGKLTILVPVQIPVYEHLPESRDIQVELIPYTMMRVLKPEVLVSPTIRKGTIKIILSDPFFPENAGSWVFTRENGFHLQEKDETLEWTISVNQLIQILTDYDTKWGKSFTPDVELYSKPVFLWDQY